MVRKNVVPRRNKQLAPGAATFVCFVRNVASTATCWLTLAWWWVFAEIETHRVKIDIKYVEASWNLRVVGYFRLSFHLCYQTSSIHLLYWLVREQSWCFAFWEQRQQPVDYQTKTDSCDSFQFLHLLIRSKPFSFPPSQVLRPRPPCLFFFSSFVSFLPPFSVSSSLPGNRGSLACGPGDVVLINSADCTLIKLSVNGPAPGSPPGVRQDGSIRKQLQIYGTAVAVATPAWPCKIKRGTREGEEKKSLPFCSHFNMQRCFLFVVAVVCFRSPMSVICIYYSEAFLSFFYVLGNTDVLLTQQFMQVENNVPLFMRLDLTGCKHFASVNEPRTSCGASTSQRHEWVTYCSGTYMIQHPA